MKRETRTDSGEIRISQFYTMLFSKYITFEATEQNPITVYVWNVSLHIIIRIGTSFYILRMI